MSTVAYGCAFVSIVPAFTNKILYKVFFLRLTLNKEITGLNDEVNNDNKTSV